MEACVGTHRLARKLAAFRHDIRLTPAMYVRPYAKNDFNDAEANRRGDAAANDEVRGDEDRRSARPSSAASGSRAARVAAHRHHQPDPRLHAATRYRGAP